MYQSFLLWKSTDLCNLHFRSKIWKFNGPLAYNWWKQVTLFVHQRFWNKTKKYFRKSCSKCFSNKKVLIKHKEVCLSINGAQYVKLEKEASKLKNALNKYKFHSKCILILSVFKQCRRLWRFLLKKYQDHIPCSFAYKLAWKFFLQNYWSNS